MGFSRGDSVEGELTLMLAERVTPLVSKNAREKLTMFLPRHEMVSLPVSVTLAT